MFDRARVPVELSAGASNVLVGTPRDIPRWCTVTNPLVREGGGPNPRQIFTCLLLYAEVVVGALGYCNLLKYLRMSMLYYGNYLSVV